MIFHTRTDGPWTPPGSCTMVSLSRSVKWPGRGVDRPSPSSTTVTEKQNYFSTPSLAHHGVFPLPSTVAVSTACVRVQLTRDGTRWRTGGEVKGKLVNGVSSQYLYTTSEHGVSSITTADAHTPADSSLLSWRPRRFKWTHPFRQKMKFGFCACAITFQTQSTTVRMLECCCSYTYFW
jgi:hypothetical protein